MSVTVNAKNQATNSGFAYDNAGRLTADGTYTYAWDGENHLASTNGVAYTYDGDGKRVMKSSGTLYWYDVGGKVIEETDLTGAVLNDYFYAAGMRLGRRDSAGRVYTYFNDPLGSPRYIQGPSSTQAESDYYPFGGERVISNTLASANNYKFTGLERDTESGLDHTLYRQFTSTYGRWLSPDPVRGCVNYPQGQNLYAYVKDNPTNSTDPSGLRPPYVYAPPGANPVDPLELVTVCTDGSCSVVPIGTIYLPPIIVGGGGGSGQTPCPYKWDCNSQSKTPVFGICAYSCYPVGAGWWNMAEGLAGTVLLTKACKYDVDPKKGPCPTYLEVCSDTASFPEYLRSSNITKCQKDPN